MEMILCQNCQGVTGHRRGLGFGTLFAVVLTGGLWLLAVPFYPKRCLTCGASEPQSLLKGSSALIVAVAVVVILLIMLPAYRWFFLISLGIGIVVAGILRFWSKYKPIKEEDVAGKRPLGL